MRIIIAIVVLAFLAPFALAHDLSEFPEPFAEEGKLNALIVVGSTAPASHVIAQTNIALMFSQEAGIQALGISKLDTDIDEINENILSIGNPCENSVSAMILGNPTDCSEGYERGKASIRVIEQGKYTHIVAAGATSEGTLAAANALRDYKSLDLEEEFYEMEVDEPKGEETGTPIEIKSESTIEAKTKAKEPQTEAKAQTDRSITDNEADGSIEEAPTEEPLAKQSAAQEIPSDKPNVFIRFFTWIGNLFG